MTAFDGKLPDVTNLPLVVLLLFLLTAPLLLNPTVYGILGVCAGLSGLIIYLRRGRIDVSVLRVGCLVAGVSAVCAVVSGYAWNPFEYTFVIGVATLLLASVAGRDDRRLTRAVTLVCTALGLLVLIGILIQYVRQVDLFGWYGLVRLPVVNLRNPNVLARYLGMIGLGIAVSAPTRKLRLLGAPFLLFVLLSASKGAILALLLAGMVWLYASGLVELSRQRWLVLGLFVLTPIVVYIAIFPGSVSTVTALQRVKLAWESTSLMLERPITGVGAWNFGLAYPSISLDAQWQRHPHSLLFWGLTSFGLAGTVAVVAGLSTFGEWNRRHCFWLPLVFVGFHELVDTMLWIPGVLLFSGLMAVGEFKGKLKPVRQSYLYLILSVLVVVSGFVIWKTDRDFKRGLYEFRNGHFKKARAFWWNDLAGFSLAHRGVAFAREGRLSRAQQSMKMAMALNEYDAYYRRTMATMLDQSRRKRTARSFLRRYGEMDPHGMLTLDVTGDGGEVADPSDGRVDVSLLRLWFNQRKPGYYVPFVRRALEDNRLDLAQQQIRFLLGLPKQTRRERHQLLELQAKITDGSGHERSIRTPGRTTDGVSRERKLFRNQFHNFFYRRPGSDHVSFGTND